MYATFTFYIQIPRANKRPSRSTEELFHASGMLLFLLKYHEPATVRSPLTCTSTTKYIYNNFAPLRHIFKNKLGQFIFYLPCHKHCVDDF